MNIISELKIIVDEDEGGYVAYYPDLPGCISCGDTVNDVKSNLEDARREWECAISTDGVALAKQAVREFQKLGYVDLICPKCHKHPAVSITPERLSVRCECGFVMMVKSIFDGREL